MVINDINKWLPIIPDNSIKTHMFCFPFSGSGPSIFKDWQKFMPADIQLCPVALPGREKRLAEPPIESKNELLDYLYALLVPYLEQPFILYGHCFGGSIAFELALRLQYVGITPKLLAVSGCKAPHMPPPIRFADLPHDEFVDSLRHFGMVPETVLNIPDLLSLFLPMLRADFTIDEQCVYTGKIPVINSPILVMYGDNDDIIPFEYIVSWNKYTEKDFRLIKFPGKHIFFTENPAPIIEEIIKNI